MTKITILSHGQWRRSPHELVYNEYLKRLSWTVNLIEIFDKGKRDELDRYDPKICDLYLKHIPKNSYLIALDENGKSLSTESFTNFFKKQHLNSISHFCFLIGGATGLHPDLINMSKTKICFGHYTWPHLMVRSMLIEQIYRVQQIILGHPYHK